MSPETATRLSHALHQAGEHHPVLVIDADRLDANADALAAMVQGKRLRLVDKSLPSAALLARVAQRTGAQSFMSFHAPYLIQTARAFPDSDILLGKPLPAPAIDAVFEALGEARFDAGAQITWLADTPQRVAEYAARARALGVALRLALEIDVGLRRGGARDGAAFDAALDAVEAGAGAVGLVGLMGYDAQAAKAPFAAPDKAVAASDQTYRGFVERARERGLLGEDAILNGAGSPTAPLHGRTVVNDVSIGSAFVKPTDFDLPQLAALQPGAFIATPILKRLEGVRVPFIEPLTTLLSGARDTVFLYGGRWMAKPVWPEGLKENALYGLSSNQQMMTLPRADTAGPGDWAFLRPTQSEAVLAQFGRLRVIEGETLAARWPVYAPEVSEVSAPAQIASSPRAASA